MHEDKNGDINNYEIMSPPRRLGITIDTSIVNRILLEHTSIYRK